MKNATKCGERSFCRACGYFLLCSLTRGPLCRTHNNVHLFAPPLPHRPFPPPPSPTSLFFSSLVSSVRNPITVIKSADPQRASPSNSRGRREGGTEEEEGEASERWWREGETKRWMRTINRGEKKKNTRRSEGVREASPPFFVTAANRRQIHSESCCNYYKQMRAFCR